MSKASTIIGEARSILVLLFVVGKPTTTDKKRKCDGLRITGADRKSKKLKKDQETQINAILAEQSSSSSDNDDNKSDDSSYVKVDELLTSLGGWI